MSDNENWHFQWSIKSPAGGMLNIRADRADELEIALQSVASMIPAMLAVEQALTAGGHVAAGLPLAPPAQQQAAQQPFPQQAPPQQQQYQQAPPQQQAPAQQQQYQQPPLCSHNLPAKWIAPGVSKSTGRPYAGFWACSLPKDQAGNCRVNA